MAWRKGVPVEQVADTGNSVWFKSANTPCSFTFYFCDVAQLKQDILNSKKNELTDPGLYVFDCVMIMCLISSQVQAWRS